VGEPDPSGLPCLLTNQRGSVPLNVSGVSELGELGATRALARGVTSRRVGTKGGASRPEPETLKLSEVAHPRDARNPSTLTRPVLPSGPWLHRACASGTPLLDPGTPLTYPPP